MNNLRHPTALRYAASLAWLVGALLLRTALNPILGTRFPYITIFTAVVIVSRYYGPGPSALAAIIGAPLGIVLFSHGQIAPTTGSAGIVPYLLVSALIIWVTAELHRLRRRAEEQALLARKRLAELRAESAQRIEEQRISTELRAIVESSADAIFSKDLDGRIRSWNRAAESIFGYAAREAVGQPIASLTPPDYAAEEMDMISHIRRGGRVECFETVRVRKDGQRIQVSLTISPICDAVGEVAGASYIARDITERKRLDEHLREIQKLESLGVLAGGLAHDFNNLLTGIMGNASLALEEARGAACAQITEILQASERAAMLVHQMLAYAGEGRFLVESLDLSRQIEEMEPLLRTGIPREIALDLRVSREMPLVEADAAQIRQVILNLVTNATEALPEGRGCVTVRAYGREDPDGLREAVLEVRDTGCGMSPETKARIFEPFFTTKFPGRGLGLPAVMGIVRAHRGSITVESEPGRGSVFTVALPARAAWNGKE